VYPKESPATITIPITISDTNGKGDSPSFTSPVFTFTTVMKAVADGNVTRTPNFSGITGPTTYGPVGNTGMAWLDGYNVGNGIGFNDSATTYPRFMHGSRGLSASSTNYGAESEQNFGPNHVTCGPQYFAPLCATFSGSRTITLTRLDASLDFVADSTNVAPGSVVTFTAKANPAVVNGQTMPVEVDSADWKPDAPPYGEAYDSTMSCGFGSLGYTCQRRIIGSGTMHVVAYVNGKRQEGSVHITTPALTLTATPAYIKMGQNVTFTPQWSDGRSTVPDMWYWTWTADHPPGNTGCGYWEDPCTKPVLETGTMKVQLRRNGVDRYATTRVVVYSSYTLDADQTTVHPGDTVTFTPKYDGAPGPAARWKWVADSGSGTTVACSAGVTPCKAKIHESGTMWAFAANAGGDSASRHVAATLPRRHLHLSPTDTVWVDTGSTVGFTASAEGAVLENVHWSSTQTTITYAGRRPPNRRTPSPPRRMSEAPGVGSSTCADGEDSCADIVAIIADAYTRAVTATVDDSVQTASVVVVPGVIGNSDGDPCWSNFSTCELPPPDSTVPPRVYRAPPEVLRSKFIVDFHDRRDDAGVFFFLTNARFIKAGDNIDSTKYYVLAMYRLVDFTLDSAKDSNGRIQAELLKTPFPPLVEIKSTLEEGFPGNFSGGFSQFGPIGAGGTWWRRWP
jgi:hypothetical protein